MKFALLYILSPNIGRTKDIMFPLSKSWVGHFPLQTRSLPPHTFGSLQYVAHPTRMNAITAYHNWDIRYMFSLASDSDKVLAKRLRTRSKLLLVEFPSDCECSDIGSGCILLLFRSRGKFFMFWNTMTNRAARKFPAFFIRHSYSFMILLL